MFQPPKVLLLIPHLGGGGAEQVTALLAQNLSRQKYELHLGLVTQTATSGEAFPPGVTVHPLGAPRVRAGAFQVLRLVWRLKPDLILSGMAHLNFLVLLLRPFFPRSTRVMVRQNATVSADLAFGDQPAYTRILYRLLYRHADRVICQTRAMAEDLAREVQIQPERLAVLPNPVQVDEIRRAIDENPNLWTGPGPHLLAVGRLSREKGFDLLLQALAIVRDQFPNADLLIAGTGREDAPLKAQCRAIGLETAVRFAGQLDRPYENFRGATALVLSSRHEGLPNVLIEAAAAGLPLVAMPASAGVVELLRNQPGTWLAIEVSAQALASALLAALEALEPEQRFTHKFVEQFRIERAIEAYEELIDQTLRHKRP